MPKQTDDAPEAPKTKSADYPTVELQGGTRLILGLGDGRVFGVNLPEPLGADEPLPALAQLAVPSLDETGCPQDAVFQKFIVN